MPLTGSPKHDIPKLINEGYPQRQAVAIAMNEQRGGKRRRRGKKEFATPRKLGFFNQRHTGLTFYKGDDGLRYLFLVTSNSYQDRDDETIRTKALQSYVDGAWTVEGRCLPRNPLLWWHDGDPIGDIVWTDMEGPFLLEVAKERRDRPIALTTKGRIWRTTIKAVWDALEASADSIRWGASHGFKSTPDDEGVFSRIKKFETSVLPLNAASNPITFAGVVDDMNKDKVLERILSMPGFADKFRKGIRAVKQDLDARGLEHKEKDAAHVKGVLDDLDAVFAEFAEKLGGTDKDTLIQELKESVYEALAKGPHAEPDEDNVGEDDYQEAEVEETAADGGAGLEDVKPEANMAMSKQVKLLDRLITSQEALASDGAEIREAVVTVAKAVNSLAPLPTSIKALEQRLDAVEKRLSGKPRRASVDETTTVRDDDLTAKARAMADTYEELFPGTGIQIRKEAAGNGNGKGGA